MTVTRFVILIATCSAVAWSGDRDPKTVTVCEIMPRLRSYRGKTVALRGRLYSGFEIFSLGGVNCQSKFITDGHVWPPTVNLVGSGHPVPSGEKAVKFDTEVKAIEKLHEITDQAQAGKEVWVTLVGQLRVKKKYVPVHTNYGILWNGYGHLGVNPAELVIKTLKDPVVK